MDTPPPYQPKKSNTGLIVGLIIGGVLLCCIGPIALIGGGGLWVWNKAKDPINCSITMKMLHDGVQDFANANDGVLPSADKWEDQVRPYYDKQIASFKKEGVPFQPSPTAGPWGCNAEGGVTTGIAFNTAISGKKISDVATDTVMLFETSAPATHNASKYDPAQLGTPPKRFSQRMWFVAPMQGEVKAVNEKGEFQDVNFNTNTSGM